MDLTTVADMLAYKQKPDLFHLQQQQFQLMAAEYNHVNLHPFPLDPFSEGIYQAKVKGEVSLPGNYLAELECMERHKMVVSRQRRDDRGASVRNWYFRHDKIQDFFLMQTFFDAHKERRQQHWGDALFRGGVFPARPPSAIAGSGRATCTLNT
jgi:hypothetical protein